MDNTNAEDKVSNLTNASIDRRFEEMRQRFTALEKAMDIAAIHSEKLTALALSAQKDLQTATSTSLDRAITKSEKNYDDRFAKTNEFREQLKDIISTLARQDKVDDAISAINARVDNSIKSTTDRFDSNVKTANDKLETLTSHILERMDQIKLASDDKRDLLYTGILQMFKATEEKAVNNITIESERFANVDKQMANQISANAEVSNKGIAELSKAIVDINKWMSSKEGSMLVVRVVLSFITAIILGLLTNMLLGK